LIGNGNFTLMVAALERANLMDALSEPMGPYTVFAPLDSAFESLPPGTVEALLLPDLQLGFIRNTRTGKTGPHMILRKMAAANDMNDAVALSADQQALCDDFVRLRALHERKMSHTPERQKPKVPGAKE
jgi:uncharacterized surface protein with fasciclin (FAS1) repeats